MTRFIQRFKSPLIIASTILLGMSWAILQPELDNNLRLWALWLLPILGSMGILLWLLFFSPFTISTKSNVFIAISIVVVLFSLLFKVEGSINGSGLPNFMWRWSKREKPPTVQQTSQPLKEPTTSATQDSPQFLGRDRNAILPPATFSTDWKSHIPHELWRHSVGEGWGAFCVIGGRAVTQEQREGEEWVSCYDLGTGALLWHHADVAHFSEWQSGDGPRTTPTHEAGKLYTLGATGILNCLELTTGKLLWKQAILPTGKNLEWGLACSPLIHEDLVIVTAGNAPGPNMKAYGKTTGEMRWESGSERAGYCSAISCKLCGTILILTQNALQLTAHDPATGNILFQYAWGSDKMPKCSQPVVIDEQHLFVSAGYQMGCEMLELSKDTANQWAVKALWAHKKMKTQFNSVTRSGNCLYGIDDGSMACIEIATGERLWKEGRFGSGQHLLLGQDQALIQSERGPIYLAKLQRSGFQELATLPALSSKTWNYPTLAGNHLLLRNDREAVCYELAK